MIVLGEDRSMEIWAGLERNLLARRFCQAWTCSNGDSEDPIPV
jgi:hypothetical protein